jgi:UDP-N-acetylmuramoyl-tripeptide--D-alanyl-D-alanine ligase
MKVSIDSRTLRPGEVYYALRGERLDGHDFVEAALEAGAGAAVIAAGEQGRYPRVWADKLRPVADPLAALQALAREHRRAWGGPLVAITGSAGKTTTKEMTAAVLATRLRVMKSPGNRNNHIGLPLALLELEPAHEVAVVEMGMNHAGEIAALAAIALPNIGVFTNVGSAHLGNFDSIEGIAAAKRELALAIPADGALVLNRDDARVASFAQGFAGRVVYYTAAGFTTPLLYPGAHNRANAAAAVATGGLFGVTPAAAAAALAGLEPPPGRGQIVHAGGMTFIHDCYNANPEAMAQMLAVLAATPGQRHVAVLGEMRELGQAAPRLHRELGAQAAAAQVDALWAIGGEAAFILEGARAAGFRGLAHFAAGAAEAAASLRAYLRPGDTVLFKASRAVHLENLIAVLLPG